MDGVGESARGCAPGPRDLSAPGITIRKKELTLIVRQLLFGNNGKRYGDLQNLLPMFAKVL